MACAALSFCLSVSRALAECVTCLGGMWQCLWVVSGSLISWAAATGGRPDYHAGAGPAESPTGLGLGSGPRRPRHVRVTAAHRITGELSHTGSLPLTGSLVSYLTPAHRITGELSHTGSLPLTGSLVSYLTPGHCRSPDHW